MRVLLPLVIIVVMAVIVIGIWRTRQSQLSDRRRAAWRAKRAEEDRIWYERMGGDQPGN